MFHLIILFFTLLLLQVSVNSQIGPEVTVLSGYYDWQTNGACPHYIQYSNSFMGPYIHVIYMTSTDSTQINTSRKTKYAFSTNNGTDWTDLGAVVSIKSGYPTLTLANDGSAVIGLNYKPGAYETTGILVDILPGIGSFSQTSWTGAGTNFAWPFVSTMNNGKIFIAAGTLQNGIATDTGIGIVFDQNPIIWQTPKKFVSDATTQSDMRWTGAAGPGGKLLYVLDPINDAGGPYGGNRIFYYTSTDNGTTWSNQNILFNSFVDPTGDTVTAWSGIDAVYDNAGNFYVAYNTIADSFQTAKLWISKNGNPGVLIVSNMQIPGSLKNMIKPMENVISIDWPSIAISEDNSFIYVAYSVFKQDDTANGFQSADVYCSVSNTSNLLFVLHHMTSSIADERYPSLYRKILLSIPPTAYIAYQKDPQPGSAVFDGAPVSRASLIYRHFFYLVEGVKKQGTEIPSNFALGQNYPNPFNPITNIKFDIAKKCNVNLIIFDIQGREVETLISNEMELGSYNVDWNASAYASGLYFYRITAGDFIQTKRLIFLK